MIERDLNGMKIVEEIWGVQEDAMTDLTPEIQEVQLLEVAVIHHLQITLTGTRQEQPQWTKEDMVCF